MARAAAGVHRLRLELVRLPAAIVADAADAYRDALLDEARTATGGDLRLSGVSWMNFALDVSVTISGSDADSQALLAPAPIFGGPSIWSWLEFGTKPHQIGTGTSRRFRNGRQRLRIGSNWITGPVDVRGMAAQHRWTRGAETGMPKAMKVVEKLFAGAVNG